MTSFWHYFYAGHPWYTGGIWGNVFVVVVVAPLGWLWSRTKFWPLRPLKHGLEHLHAKVDAFRQEHREAHAALHDKLNRQGASLKYLHERHDEHADRLEALHAKLDALNPPK